jgi:glycine cleavage system H protein
LNGLYYTRQHEWVSFINQTAFIGITGKGLNGDVVYVELPEIGKRVKKGEPCAKVESVKADIEVSSPVEGVVSAINDAVFDDPDMIATHPMGAWLFKLEIGTADTEGLLTEAEYKEL